jgi:predicted esterase
LEELSANQQTPGVLIHGDADPDVGVRESDEISDIFSDAGWEYYDNWRYFRIPDATHEWQSHLNQEMWDWLYDHPNPLYNDSGRGGEE